jgi:hypothetical protein
MNPINIKNSIALFTTCLLLMAINPLSGQDIDLKSGHLVEKKILKGMTQNITIGNPRGTFQWQQSTNGATWQDMPGKNLPTLTVTVTTIIYLRCGIKEPVCDMVYSDVLKLIPFDVPVVSTMTISNISGTSASGGGTVISDENSAIIARGVCWATTHNPTTSNSSTNDGSSVGVFTSSITGLSSNVVYYVRAYASNIVGTSYGAEVSFRTVGSLSTVTTTAITAITNVTATGGGNITNDGSSAITARGVCWSTTENPTTAASKTSDGPGTGVFVSSLTGLSATTTYYVRAYSVNASGTAYGAQVSFRTLSNIPAVSTTPVTMVGTTTAITGGNVTSSGGGTVTARGVCWSTTTGPTIASTKSSDGTGTGTFISNLTGLAPNTIYYVRAYATNSTGTGYGQEHSFTTRIAMPTVTTAAITGISNIAATGGGNVTADGNSPVTAKGICWATTQNPTTALTTKTLDGAGTGAFVSALTELTPNTTYYVRAYAVNVEGTSYGAEVFFKTNQSVTPPSITTAAITNIAATTATGGGNVTSDGNSTVTVRGVCWSTSENPTTANDTTMNGTGKGIFVSNLINLTPNVTYYLRAYAINAYGKTYGEQVSFKTPPAKPTVTTTAITNILSTTATGGGNVTNDGRSAVTERGICWSIAANPTTADPKTIDGADIGIFASSLTGLTANTTYYVRAYATNISGTGYGDQVSFTTLAGLPITTTAAISAIAATTATSGGTITSTGNAAITAKGVCWSTVTQPTTADGKTTDGTGTNSYVSSLTGLLPFTTYFVRSYATNLAGTGYGNELSFKTLRALPTVTTTHISTITTTTASGGGNVTSTGGDPETVKGICWSTSHNPTISHAKTEDGTGEGPYSSHLTNLTPNTTYYVRAYATNPAGTAYGSEVEFKTLQ